MTAGRDFRYPPTEAQLSYLTLLTNVVGVPYVKPVTATEASRQITLLKQEPRFQQWKEGTG